MHVSTTKSPPRPTGASMGGEPIRRQVTVLGRLAGWCFDHRIKAVGIWFVALLTIFGAAGIVGSNFSAGSAVPGSGSAAGFAVLEKHFPELGTGGQSGTIVFKARQGVENSEVRAAMEALFGLVDAGFPDSKGVPQHPGGTVISPYSAQVRLLRELLPDNTLEIDTVDGFQGREKEAVVISLVRSNRNGELGFLTDTRRMNVALTRARRKLIVVGDSSTLASHEFYFRLLEFFERIIFPPSASAASRRIIGPCRPRILSSIHRLRGNIFC